MTKNILDSISGEDALRVLRNLCNADAAIHKRVLSEVKEQAPDVPAECFGWVLDEWRGRCTQEHSIEEMNEFISR